MYTTLLLCNTHNTLIKKVEIGFIIVNVGEYVEVEGKIYRVASIVKHIEEGTASAVCNQECNPLSEVNGLNS